MMFELDGRALLARLIQLAAEVLLLLLIVLTTLMTTLLIMESQRKRRSLAKTKTSKDPEDQKMAKDQSTEDQMKGLKPEEVSSERKEHN